MAARDWLQLALFAAALTALTPPIGAWLKRVFCGERHWTTAAFGWLERGLCRISGVDPKRQMDWRQYAGALIAFNVIGIAFVWAVQMAQSLLPLNPQALGNVPWATALNTAISFVTNTNWQSYSGETTMSHLTQMLALTSQNFLSAAVGLCVAVALTRGIANRQAQELGNFWVDLTRAVVHVFLPICLVYALVLVAMDAPQTLSANAVATTLEGALQAIPLGPVASQVAIKMFGTNGGGFFNANAAHPFENPSALANFLQMLSIFAIPAGLTYAYGLMTGARRHGWVLYGAMLAFFLALTGVSLWAEYGANPALGVAGLMEGKESRFGVFGSVLFSTVTTSASCGAVNAMHASLSPLAGGVAMLNMMLGEVVFGGVGAGLYGMILFVLLTVFLAGLMVGRTPEYLGKKIEAREMTMVLLAVLAPCAAILLFSGVSLALPAGLAGLSNAGPHGLSEILYAFTSAAANNGSAFAGLNANTVYYNLTLGAAMLIGRFAIILPALAIAGSLAEKKRAPPSPGTFETDTLIFAALLASVIAIVGALTFFPAFSLGPIIEHFLMLQGRTF